jgi:hypothetical protein
MEEIEIRISIFNDLSDICKRMVKKSADKHPSTLRAYKAMQFFEKATLHSVSFIKLWPTNKAEILEQMDAAALASIARVMIETHNVFHYLVEKGISSEEFEFRLYLANLHQSKKTQEILAKFQFAESDGTIQIFEMSERANISFLEDNQIYKLLGTKQKLELIKGKNAYYFERMKNIKYPLEPKIESGIYNLLSNSVHSFPLGLTNYSVNKNDNPLSWFNLIFISLEICIIYLASIARSYLEIRKNLFASISQEDKYLIRNLMNNANLVKWIEIKQDEGQKSLFSTNSFKYSEQGDL